MAFNLRQGLIEAAGVGEKMFATAGLEALRSELEEKKLARLEALRHENQLVRDERQFQYQRDLETGIRQPFTAEQNRLTRESHEGIARLSSDTQLNIANLHDATQRFMAETRNAQDERQHTERMAALNRQLSIAQQQLAMSGIKIVNDRDGMAMSYTSIKDGKPTVEYIPITHNGQRVRAGQAENIPAIANALAHVAQANAKFLETPTALVNPEAAAVFTNQMRALNQAATSLMAGLAGGQGGGAGTGWDTETKQVLHDGKVIGTAATEAEARSLIAKHRGGGGVVTPTENDIAKLRSLRSNPAAVAAFDAKFGANAASRYLAAPGGGPGRPPLDQFFGGSLISPQAETYDEEGNLREPEREHVPVRRGPERRGLILRSFEPELLNQ